MAIPRVDISQEIADWQAAVYGEEVRSANVSALTKLQTQMNNACDGIETAQTDVATAVNTANAASATANQASSDAQDAIDDAQAAITTAQGYAANAEGSAQAAAASATAAQTAQTNAQTAQLAAEAAEQAAEDAARQAQIAINITPDEETIHHASDAVGTISAITYTLEEIAAMTDPSGKIPDASAVESLRESLSNSLEWKLLASQQGSVPVSLPTSWNELNIVIQFPWNSIYGDSFLIQRSHVGNANPHRYSHGYYNTASDAGAWSFEAANGQVMLLSCVRNGAEQVANAIMLIYYR